MIDLTPLDVRNKRGDFKKIMRGYDPEQVDTFLEIAAERLEALVRENIQLRERTQTLQEQVSVAAEREQAVQDALVTAQGLRADMQAQSQREADHILKEAGAEAKRLVTDAEDEARRKLLEADNQVRERVRGIERRVDVAKDSLSELEHRRARFLKDFRNLLQRELDGVQVESERAPFADRAIELDLGARTVAASVKAIADASEVAEAVADEPGITVEAVTADQSETATPTADEDSAIVAEDVVDGDHAPVSADAEEVDVDPEPAILVDPPAAERLDTVEEGSVVVAAASLAPTPSQPPPLPSQAAPEPIDVRSLGPESVAATAEADVPSPIPDAAVVVPPVAPHVRSETLQPPPAPDVPRSTSEATSDTPRPRAPSPTVDGVPSALELELMAGAAGIGSAPTEVRPEDGVSQRFAGVPDLETVLAEAGIDSEVEEVTPPPHEEGAPPPAPGIRTDNLILFDADKKKG